jgi:endonuclease/exonuclease/phosphatase family metal-dependent hydrolase
MDKEGTESLKIVQLNIWQGRLLNQIIAFLEHEKPDIICLQEVYSSGLETPLLPFFSGLEHIQRTFPEYHTFFSPISSMDVLGLKVSYGNAILSRFPLEDTETFEINGSYQFVHTPDEMDSNTRNLQRVSVVAPESSFTLLNHHGYWEPSAVGSDITAAKMQLVADIVSKSHQPLVLVGDLNIAPHSPAMAPIQAQLRDLTQEYKLSSTLSKLSRIQDVPCDHICVSKDILVDELRSDSSELLSDHLPLILEFRVKSAG